MVYIYIVFKERLIAVIVIIRIMTHSMRNYSGLNIAIVGSEKNSVSMNITEAK